MFFSEDKFLKLNIFFGKFCSENSLKEILFFCIVICL